MTVPTHLLVANPAAQSGRNAARIDRALRLLEAAGLRTESPAISAGSRSF